MYVSLPDHCHSLISYVGEETWHYGKSRGELKYLPSLASAKDNWRKMLSRFSDKNAFVVLSKGTTVCNIKLMDLRNEHRENEDLTIFTHEHLPIGTYILSIDLLLELLEVSQGFYSWITLLESQIRNLSCLTVEIDGYGKDINSIDIFYQANMEILWPARMKSLLFEKSPIFSNNLEHQPTVYGSHSRVINSLVGQGCVIDGTVENSIIFPNCRVEKDVFIRNCIVMEDSFLEKGKFEQMIYGPAFTLKNIPIRGIS